MPIKLHLGCGKRNFGPDWIHVDGSYYSHAQQGDVATLTNFSDNSADLIYASHVLEYFSILQSHDVLTTWRCVLKPGGTLRIAVPDFRAMAELYASGKFNLKHFLGPIYGTMVMDKDFIHHKTGYDFETLKEALEIAGFKNVHRYNWKKTEHAYFDDHSQAYLPHMDKSNGTLISLNVEATK